MTDEASPQPSHFDEQKVTYFYNQLVRRALKDVIREIMAYGYEMRVKEEKGE